MRTPFAAALFAASFLIAGHAWARQPNCNPDGAIAAVHVTADRPALMAIGDSLYDGVESLSLAQPKVNLSTPALVAGKLLPAGSFRIPQYGVPLLIDLDVALKQSWYDIVNKTGRQTVASIDAYADPHSPNFPKAQKFFDNIAVAQADSVALICDTAVDANMFVNANYHPNAPSHVATIAKGIPANIESWFYALNSRYVLNPTHNSVFDHLSQLDEVLLRKPRMLLVNIGSNDGVWLMAFNGYTPSTCYSTTDPNSAIAPCGGTNVTSVQADINELTRNMRLIARKLKQYTPDTLVIMNLLPRPSAAANLSPPPDNPDHPAHGHAYFPRYQNYMGTAGIRTVSGRDVAAMDRAIASANDRIVAGVCAILAPRHVAFMDLYKLLAAYDYKNNPAAKQVTVNLRLDSGMQPVTIDNRLLGTHIFINRGGMFSYDNMHPTVLGYTLVANAVLNTITRLRSWNAHGTAHGCLRQADDTPVISFQSTADKINGANRPSRVATALQVDDSIYRFLGGVHDILQYETPKAPQPAIPVPTAMPPQSGTVMHALFRMEHYPARQRHQPHATPADSTAPAAPPAH